MKWFGKALTSSFLALAIGLLLATLGFASWQQNGNPVSIPAGLRVQPRVVTDGEGGAIIAWEDRPNDGADAYAQRVDGSGKPLWTEDGVGICTTEKSQGYPYVASDSAGGVIVAWNDGRGITADIYVQRVDRNGNWGYPYAWQVAEGLFLDRQNKSRFD